MQLWASGEIVGFGSSATCFATLAKSLSLSGSVSHLSSVDEDVISSSPRNTKVG
jgi:hypothetical protein